MIEVKHVSGGYCGHAFLKDISLTIPAGAITAIIGPNGCGKSTLLRLIAGLQKPYSGDIVIGGKPLEAYTRNQLAKTVSFLPQNRHCAAIRADSLVLHGRFPYMGYPRHYREEDQLAAEAAMAWAGVTRLRHRLVPTLSGGERQKVYIAMLLAQGTPVVLMDEPTSMLDIAHKFDVIRLAREMKQQGKTVVMVLHDLDLALGCADQVILMDQGQIRLCASPGEMFQSSAIEDTFHVQAGAVDTGNGTQYFFRPI